MDYREELAKRLQGVPWSARQIALEAGVSPAWVAKAKKREAHKISWETAQTIHAAIDRLGKAARPDVRDEVVHPGVEELSRDRRLMESMGITDAMIAAARTLFLVGADGKPIIIATVAEALDYLRVMQRHWPPDAGRA